MVEQTLRLFGGQNKDTAPSLTSLASIFGQALAALSSGDVQVEVSFKISKGATTANPADVVERPSRGKHSADFRCATWNGRTYTFSPTQAAVVQVLWEAMENDTPVLSQQTILTRIGSESAGIRDLFRGTRNSEAFGTLIVPAGRGMYRLAEEEVANAD